MKKSELFYYKKQNKILEFFEYLYLNLKICLFLLISNSKKTIKKLVPNKNNF